MKGKKIGATLAVVFVILGLNFTSRAEDVYEEWVAIYNGPGNQGDHPLAIASDPQGNFYITGYSYISDSGGNFTTIKYSPFGEILWVRRHRNPDSESWAGFDIALDDSGDVYVTGENATIKYSTDGEINWTRYSRGRQIAVDRGMNAIVSDGSYAGSKLIKYNPVGDSLWSRQHFYVNDLNVESLTERVYVTGASGNDFGTAVYSSNGDLQWLATYDSGFGNTDVAKAIDVDEFGNVYVTGRSQGYGILFDIVTIKYDSWGNVTWLKRFKGPLGVHDSACRIKVDVQENVYVAGTADSNDSPSIHTENFVCIKYTPDGDTLWTRYYDGPVSGVDVACDMALDDSANVYVAGYSVGIGSETDFATLKYKSDGSLAWLKRYNRQGVSIELFPVIALDRDGNVCLTGWSLIDNTDWITIKYSPCTSSSPKAGDASLDNSLSIADVVRTVDYIFNRGPILVKLPPCDSNLFDCWVYNQHCRYDWNGDKKITLGDCIRALNFLFQRPGDWSPVPSLGCCPFPPQ
ncbi:MAG: hypothetical protein A2Z27_06185 [candidate division Zixibacteria bacterium RBG_16_50_21]|nr:MAG: hypothetical protein A2Z27_06185 [candidate division Zixibacteria bacterium RBG_16_50_21]